MTVAGFVAAVTGVAVVVLGLGLIRVHPLLALGLNIVAAGGLLFILAGAGALWLAPRGRRAKFDVHARGLMGNL